MRINKMLLAYAVDDCAHEKVAHVEFILSLSHHIYLVAEGSTC